MPCTCGITPCEYHTDITWCSICTDICKEDTVATTESTCICGTHDLCDDHLYWWAARSTCPNCGYEGDDDE